MDPNSTASEFSFEKRRADAVVTLSNGNPVRGCFFTAGCSARHDGPERISDLLNSETEFFPFEVQAVGAPGRSSTTAPRSSPCRCSTTRRSGIRGYAVATRRIVSLLLSDGHRVEGAVRVYRPEGRDRVSDWTRQPEIFRYVEGQHATFIVNATHIVAVTEVAGS